MRTSLLVGLLAVTIWTQAAAADAKPFAALEAPVANGWTPPERWKDEVVDGKPACRTAQGACYGFLNVLGEIPKSGNVLMRVTYHSAQPFAIGIGGWGARTCVLQKSAGWQTEDLIFPATAIGLENGKIRFAVTRMDENGPALNRVELLVPSQEQTMAAFRKWVVDATAEAFATATSKDFQLFEADEAKLPLEASKDDEARGAIPFVRSYLRFVYPTTTPAKEERTQKAGIMLTPGEYEPFQFAIKALKDYSKLTAEVVGKSPAGISVDLRWVECAPIKFGGSSSHKSHIQPNRLWPKEIFPTCTAKAQEARAWWAIVKADDSAKAGTLPLKIAIKNDGKELLTFELEVRVLPFTLPKKMERSFMLTDSSKCADEAILADLREHGINTMGAFDAWEPIGAGENLDFGDWDAHFARLKHFGIDSAFIWYLGNPRSGNAVLKDLGGDQAKFIALLKELDQRVADGRYPPLFALSVDEAVLSGNAFADEKNLYQMITANAPHLKVLGCALDEFGHTVKYDGMIHILSCNGSHADNSKWCHERGVLLNTYAYTCASVDANATRLHYGFFSWQHDARIVNGWALRWNNGHPYNDLDAGIADWGILLPSWVGAPISSPAYEGLREGYDDARYLAVYEQLVKDGKASDALLKEIRANGIGQADVAKETVIGDSMFGVSLKNAAQLDVARARVIAEIVKAK